MKIYRSSISTAVELKSSYIDEISLVDSYTSNLLINDTESEDSCELRSLNVNDTISLYSSTFNDLIVYYTRSMPPVLDLRNISYENLDIKFNRSNRIKLISLRGSTVGKTEFSGNDDKIIENIDLVGCDFEKLNIFDNKSILSAVNWKVHKINNRDLLNRYLNHIDYLLSVDASLYPTALHTSIISHSKLRDNILTDSESLYRIVEEYDVDSSEQSSSDVPGLQTRLDRWEVSFKNDEVKSACRDYIRCLQQASEDLRNTYLNKKSSESYLTDFENQITHNTMKWVSTRQAARTLVISMASDDRVRQLVLHNKYGLLGDEMNIDKICSEYLNNARTNKYKIRSQVEILLEDEQSIISIQKVAEYLESHPTVRESIASDEETWGKLKYYERKLTLTAFRYRNSQQNITPALVEETYMNLKKSADKEGNDFAASRFFEREKRSRLSQYIYDLKSDPISFQGLSSLNNLVGNLFLWVTSGYGEHPGRVITFSVAIVGIFSLAYIPFWGHERLLDILILSVSSFVTLVHSGSPTVNDRILMVITQIQGFVGAFMIGLFVFTLTRSVHR
jgi:hypothetical protein